MDELQDSPFDDVENPSASVLIQMDERMISDRLVPEVKQLIALAHPNIKYDRVGVVVTPVSILKQQIPFTDVAGILVKAEDAMLLRIILIYAAAATVLTLAAAGWFALQFKKSKGMEAVA